MLQVGLCPPNALAPLNPLPKASATVTHKSKCATIYKNPIPPQQPPSLPEAVRMIATLGGFLGRKGDGELGVKTIWRSRTVSKRGLRRLHDITATWKLVDQIS